jgi:alkylresorcinol/alkylpyrone synthase
MGFTVDDGGLHVVLDRAVPEVLAGRVRPLVERLCGDHGLALEDLAFAALHPGGRRILATLERELGLAPEAVAPALQILKDHGNMSSATVLFVLDDLLRRPPPPPGRFGLLAAFGPGFAAELSLLRWAR